MPDLRYLRIIFRQLNSALMGIDPGAEGDSFADGHVFDIFPGTGEPPRYRGTLPVGSLLARGYWVMIPEDQEGSFRQAIGIPAREQRDYGVMPAERIAIGPQSESDGSFARRMRWHQSWYRTHVLKVPYGTGPWPRSRTLYGNMLTEQSAEAGLNFLTPAIFELAKRRVAAGTGTVESFRLMHNMLGSQPMCFNLFGELAHDHELATRLVRVLWGEHIARITGVHIEWAPMPAAEYLDDRTAFDAFIEYETQDDRAGFIGIETKLSETFSPRRYDQPAYRRWMTPDSPWRADASDEVAKREHNQLWRDHLLAWSLLRHPESKYAVGELSVLYHPEDHRCRDTVAGYRALLRDETTFSSFDLAQVVSAWKPLAGQWLSQFEQRYLALASSS